MAFSAIIGDDGAGFLGGEQGVWRAADNHLNRSVRADGHVGPQPRNSARGTRIDAPEPEPTA